MRKNKRKIRELPSDIRLFFCAWGKWKYGFRTAWYFAFCQEKISLEDYVKTPLEPHATTLAANTLTAEDLRNAFNNMKDV